MSFLLYQRTVGMLLRVIRKGDGCRNLGRSRYSIGNITRVFPVLLLISTVLCCRGGTAML